MASSAKVPGENVTDLEDIVKRWAGEVYEITKTKDQARIPKEAIMFNINWKQVKFHFDDPKYEILPLFPGANCNPNSHSGPTTPSKHVFQPQTLFRTYFSNTTGQEQEYSFKTERCTRSTCTVCVETGFSRGFDFGLKLTVPGEVAEANAGFKREVTVTNIGEDTIEEELIWAVDNSVKVPANTETIAELVITEAQCQATFSMDTKFHGKVLITVTNVKENNSLVTVMEGNIADIMQREVQRGLKGFKVQGKVVIAETRGKCNFKYGIEQRVRISERPIPIGGVANQ